MSKQKHDFTKTMRNIDLSEEKTTRSRGKDLQHIEIKLSTSEKNHIKKFMQHEVSYYNSVVTSFSSRIRSFPEHLLEFTEEWTKLFSKIAETGFNIRNMERANETAELPKDFEEFRTLLLGKDAQGKRFLTERRSMLMNIASAPGNIHPVVRRNMALELLKFYKEQANIALQTVDKHSEDAFRSPPAVLENYDLIRKRHLQIPRSIVTSKWNHEKEVTELSIPYISNPINIPRLNLNDGYDWNLIILHQEPGMIAASWSPWVLDIFSGNAGYMIKYADVKNPYAGSSFQLAKKRDF